MKVLAALLVIATVPAMADAQYRITSTFPVGGDGSWDYVVPDPPNHRIFIGRQNRVMVVVRRWSTAAGKVVATLPIGAGTDGAAFDPATGARNMGLDPVTHRVFVVTAKMGPAPAESTAANPRRRPQIIPGSFVVMVVEKTGR